MSRPPVRRTRGRRAIRWPNRPSWQRKSPHLRDMPVPVLAGARSREPQGIPGRNSLARLFRLPIPPRRLPRKRSITPGYRWAGTWSTTPPPVRTAETLGRILQVLICGASRSAGYLHPRDLDQSIPPHKPILGPMESIPRVHHHRPGTASPHAPGLEGSTPAMAPARSCPRCPATADSSIPGRSGPAWASSSISNPTLPDGPLPSPAWCAATGPCKVVRVDGDGLARPS